MPKILNRVGNNLISIIMRTKKFIKISKVKKLKDSDLKNIKGGVIMYSISPIYTIDPTELAN